MKRFFSVMFMLLLVTTSVVKAEKPVTEVVNSVVDSASVAVKENASTFMVLYEDLKTGVTALASALKVPAEHVYAILVKQQVVNSLTYLVVFILASISLFISCRYGLPWASEHGDDSDGASYVLPVLGILIFGVIVMFVLFNMDTIMTGILNPEYGAIQDIVKMVKGI